MQQSAKDTSSIRTKHHQTVNKKKQQPSSSIASNNNSSTTTATTDESSENSFGGDFLGIFRGYLRGDGSVEDTRRRLVVNSNMKHHHSTTSIINHVGGNEKKPSSVQGRSDAPPNGSTTEHCCSSNSWNFTTVITVLLRTFLLDLPLALLFALFLVSWLILAVHNEFYQPLFDRATRTDAQLLEEFTYYERQCTEYDLSTRNIQDMLLLNDTTKTDDIIPTAVEIMMKHGATVIPAVLQPNTTAALREYIVRKNNAITAAEAYPMSQGEHRLSFGIDASEDPAVSDAIAQVAAHPVLRPLLQALLGDDDPASAEITSITAFAGAEDQVWHQDTKQDGNAIKFARTYSHSYSLFLPLQDTTERMGATDICPGTHYCLNDLAEMCEKTKMGLHLVGGDTINISKTFFPAGAGALLNQHVWHRGGAHTDPHAPERIVFILSFLARPKYNDDDVRQLSRGTYFHQKWNMWGHTWQDLMTPATSMRYPFSVLRCLSLWKPLHAHWGYDLITSGFLRFSNEQLEEDDFEFRFLPRLDEIGFPHFLRGRYIPNASQRDTWQVFLRETFENVYNFCKKVNLYVHCGYYLALLIGAAVWLRVNEKQRDLLTNTTTLATAKNGRCILRRATLRLVMTHGLLLAFAGKLWRDISSSQWGQSIKSGRTLMRPFPPVDSYTEEHAVMVSKGPTTMPTRNDVLIGSRFDAEFLGSYDKWLDYHPGNAKFRQAAAEHAAAFALSKQIGSSAASNIVQKVVDAIRSSYLRGRFLQQDFRTGDWRVMTESEVSDVVAEELAVAGSSKAHLSAVRQSIDWMIADNRFGPRLRATKTMARTSQLRLWHLRRSILLGDDDEVVVALSDESSTTASWSFASGHKLRVPKSALPRIPKRAVMMSRLRTLPDRHPSIPVPDNREDVQVGSLVWVYYEESDEWLPGTVMNVVDDDRVHVSFEDNTWDEGVLYTQLYHYSSVTEGDRIQGCFEDELNDCWPGTVVRCLPSGHLSIAYDDGDFDDLVPPTRYYQPPFAYEGPFYV